MNNRKLSLRKLELEYVTHDHLAIVSDVALATVAEHEHEQLVQVGDGAVADICRGLHHDELAVDVVSQGYGRGQKLARVERCLVKWLRVVNENRV